MDTPVRKARKAKDLTQAALAAAVGVHVTTISRIERGEVWTSRAVAQRIAAQLGIPPDQVLLINEPIS